MYLILTQCFPPVVGGIENLIGELALALTTTGEKVSVFADGAPATMDAKAPYHVRRFGGWKVLRRWQKARAANAALQQGGVRHLFCDSWKSLEYVKKSDNVVITVFAHGSEYPKTPTVAKKQRIVSALSRADHVLAVSAATRTRMQKCGVDADNVVVWHPPIGGLSPPTDEARKYASQLWDNCHPKILSVARLTTRKGLDTAIRAIQTLTTEYPQVRYVIAGDGHQAEELRILTKQCGVEKHLIFAGTVSAAQKGALYESADLFVLPVRESGDDMEGFGLVFLEAAFYKLPAVTGNMGGAAEAVEDGITGLHCNGENTDSVCRAMIKILSDDSLRRTLGGNAAQKAAANLWAKRLPELLRV